MVAGTVKDGDSDVKFRLARLKGQLSAAKQLYEIAIRHEDKLEFAGIIKEIQCKIRLITSVRSTRSSMNSRGHSMESKGRRIRIGKREPDRPYSGVVNYINKHNPGESTLTYNPLRVPYFPVEYYRLDLSQYSILLEDCRSAKNAEFRGRSLEKLALFLFNSGGELFNLVYSNVRTDTHEVDLIITPGFGTFLKEWSDWIIVECKNRKERSPSRYIDVISSNLRLTRSKGGIIISLSGCTKDAKKLMHNLFLLDGTGIIPIDGNDLNGIAKGNNLVKVLWDKLNSLRIGRWDLL